MINSIPAQLFANAQRQPNAPAYRHFDGKTWASTDWSTYGQEVRRTARALIALGVKEGDTICILGNNRPEWVIADVAAMAVGGVPAGIYATCSAEEVAFVVSHAEAGVIVVENLAQLQKVESRVAHTPNLRHVIVMRGAGPVSRVIDAPTPVRVLDWDTFLTKEETVSDSEVERRLNGLNEDDTATLIYTSGTTGNPKGVMLTHRNLTHTAKVAAQICSVPPDTRMVSYLPLSHIAEQMFSIHAAITIGYEIWYARSMETLLEDMQAARPTILFGVPRVWEKMHAKLSARLAEASGVKGAIARWATDVGRRVNAERNAGRSPGAWLGVQYKLADRLLYSKVKGLLGLDKTRFGISGAAPISAAVLEFFSGLDIVIHEVYGQSEDCGPTSFNVPGRTRYGTVGPAIPGCDLRIADDGEVLVRGPNVFKGYFKDPAATAETLVDGWLHSGDLGKIDADGFLSIVGRKKDILITSGGKNITPVNIEAKLKDLPLVSQAVVIGDNRNYITALVTLDAEAAAAFATARGLPTDSLHTLAEIRAELQRGVDEQVNPSFARVEHVRKFAILASDFSAETDELTPTQKIKRRVVNAKYKDIIEGLYAD